MRRHFVPAAIAPVETQGLASAARNEKSVVVRL
jgi:hypothetical protein